MQDLTRALSQRGRGIADRQALAVQPVRRCEHRRGALDGVRHVLHQAAAARALAGQRFVQACHLAAGDAGRGQALQQQVAREGGDQLLEHGTQLQPVLGAVHVGGKARVLDDIGPLDHLAAELVELRVVAHRNDQRAVSGLVHAVRHDGRVRIAVALGVVTELERVQAVVAGDGEAAVVQRHLDQAPAPRSAALEQRRQHGLAGVHAGHQVHHGDTELQRRRARLAVERHEAGLALDHQVVAGALGLGAAGVVAGHGAVDEVGLEGLELLVAQAQLLGAAGLEVVDHHVALRQQLVDDLQPLGTLQVEGDGPLVAVHAVVVGGLGLADAHAPVAGIVAAARVLHLDDLGPQVRQYLAAQRPGEHAGKIKHPHAVERKVDVVGRCVGCHGLVSLDIGQYENQCAPRSFV